MGRPGSPSSGRVDAGRKPQGTFHVVGKSAHDLGLKARRGTTSLFKFKLFCADTKPRVEMPKLAEMRVVYGKRGFVDRKKSDLTGEGR